MSPDIIEIRTEGLGKTFDDHVVLRDVGLEIRRGEIVAIVGESGCGKTVLLHMILGLLDPTAGHVRVADHELPGAPLVDLIDAKPELKDEVRLTWAVVFQRNALFSATVYENCALWLREHTKLEEAEIRERVHASVESVGLDVDEVMDLDRDELSGGMAKRVAVARAVAVDPVVIFYDEPTTGLDPVSATHIHELIWDTHHRPRTDGTQRTTVIVTHDRDLLRRVHPRVIMLQNEGVCFDGPYAQFTEASGPPQEYLALMPALHARPVTV